MVALAAAVTPALTTARPLQVLKLQAAKDARK